jgi:hypothetical protein
MRRKGKGYSMIDLLKGLSSAVSEIKPMLKRTKVLSNTLGGVPLLGDYLVKRGYGKRKKNIRRRSKKSRV